MQREGVGAKNKPDLPKYDKTEVLPLTNKTEIKATGISMAIKQTW